MNANDMHYMAGLITHTQYMNMCCNYRYVHLKATACVFEPLDYRLMCRNEENKQFFGDSWPTERNRFTLFKAARK